MLELFLLQRSHVKGGVQLLGQLQYLHLEAILNVHQDCFVCSALLVLLLVSADEVDSETLCSETASSAHTMQVGVALSWEVYMRAVVP
jgi:hypothetical protein